MAGCAREATPVAADTPPDLNGIWVIADSFMDKQDGTFLATPGRATDAPPPAYLASTPPMQGEYLKQAEEEAERMNKGTPTADPTADCLPQGVAAWWIGPYAFEILQSAHQVNISQEWNDQTRRVYLDGRSHPEDPDPSFNGHSVGKWENGVLVIDTIGFNTETLLNTAGARHSDKMHVTERIRQTAPDLIEVTQIIEDPEALAAPWERQFPLRRKSGMEIGEYVCAQNNRNPVGADGVTQAILKGDQK